LALITISIYRGYTVKNTRMSKFKCAAAMQALTIMGAGLAVSTIAATPLMAQDYTNVTASGRVISTDGTPISGAEITVKSNGQGFERTVTTDANGSYRVPQLPTGSYTFSIAASGFDEFVDTNVTLGADRSANQFSLAPSGGGSEIVVTAGRIQIVDFERNTTGSVIEIGELATRVPVARDITSVVLLAPGTTQGDSAFGNLPNIAGASVAENAYYVNGLNITEFREGLGAVAIPFEFYQTVEVKNGGYAAEFGRATGGIINAVTKSGSNDIHAGVLVNYEPNWLRSNAKDTVFSENSRESAHRLNSTFYVSGPIIKDRLFVYGLYEARNVTSTDTITSIRRQCPAFTTGGGVTFAEGNQSCGLQTPAIPRSSDNFEIVGSRIDKNRTSSPFYAVKVDAIPIDGHRFEATYFNTTGKTITDSFGYNSFNSQNSAFPTLGSGIAGTPGQGRGSGQAVFGFGGENYVGRYTGQFTDWLTLSAAYGKNKYRDTVGSSDDTLPNVFDTRSGQTLANSVASVSLSNDTREFYRADVDLRFDLMGSHHIKFGYDREDLTTNTVNTRTGGANFTYFNSGPLGDAVVTAPNVDYVTGRVFVNGGVFESQNEAYYIQDSWSLFADRLVLNLGVRNDRFQNSNVAGDIYYKSGDNWAPRLGFSFDVFNDSSTKLYGSFGRYYLPVAANTNIRLAGAELDFTRFNVLNGINPDGTPIIGAPLNTVPAATACPQGGGNNCTINSDGVPTPTESTVSKSLKSQSVDEYIVGAERKFGGNWSAGIYYTRTRLNAALEDAAIDAAVNAYCAAEGISGCPGIWSGFHQYVLVNPGQGATITLSDPIDGETTLRTVEFSAEDLALPAAKRKYDAVTLKVDREFDGKWSLSGSYTWSRLFGNYEGSVKSDNGQTDAGLTTDFDQPGLTNGSLGLSPNHRRHNFKLFGSYQLTDWLMIGANFSATSPRKFGCIGRIPASIDPFGAQYGAAGFYCNVDASGNIITDERTGVNVNAPVAGLTPRGSVFESDWQTQTNLSFIFRLPVDTFQGDLRLDVFNVFNEKSALDFEERGTLGSGAPRNTYQQPTRYQAPRAIRLQLGLRF
jgi:Carboxypeptidase regulatory-like domain/TonB-dependent Receptor Plug Domain